MQTLNMISKRYFFYILACTSNVLRLNIKAFQLNKNLEVQHYHIPQDPVYTMIRIYGILTL